MSISANDRVWLITGASSGFGRALAEAALARGDLVVGAARRVERLERTGRRAPRPIPPDRARRHRHRTCPRGRSGGRRSLRPARRARQQRGTDAGRRARGDDRHGAARPVRAALLRTGGADPGGAAAHAQAGVRLGGADVERRGSGHGPRVRRLLRHQVRARRTHRDPQPGGRLRALPDRRAWRFPDGLVRPRCRAVLRANGGIRANRRADPRLRPHSAAGRSQGIPPRPPRRSSRRSPPSARRFVSCSAATRSTVWMHGCARSSPSSTSGSRLVASPPSKTPTRRLHSHERSRGRHHRRRPRDRARGRRAASRRGRHRHPHRPRPEQSRGRRRGARRRRRRRRSRTGSTSPTPRRRPRWRSSSASGSADSTCL